MAIPKPYHRRDGMTIYQGDCREIVPELRFDLIITDPPYGIAHRSNGQAFILSRPIANDDSSWPYEFLSGFECPTMVFFSPYRWPALNFRSVLVWNKGDHVGIGGDRATCWKRDFELIGVRNNGPLHGQRDSAVLSFPALLPPPSGHVAEKPIGLMRYLCYKLAGPSNPRLTILDPFAGSGSTLRAAMDLGHRAIGIELDETYCKVATDRLRQAVLFT